MLSKFISKIQKYFKEQREEQELKDLFKIDYRLEKELMAISKKD